jgi:hypothetical protein
MNPIWQVIKEAATSKKFIMTVAGVVTAAALKINLDISTEAVATILSPLLAYLIGQGWADSGKEAAKIEGAVALAAESDMTVEQAKEKLL